MKEYFRLQMALPGFDTACSARRDLDSPRRAAGRQFYDALRSTTCYEKKHMITNLSFLTLLIHGWHLCHWLEGSDTGQTYG